MRDGIWIALGQGAVALAGLVGVRVLTTLLPPAEYGEVTLLTGLGTLGYGLLLFPFLQTALRFYPDARDAGEVAALRGMTAHDLRRGGAGVAAMLLAAGAVSAGFDLGLSMAGCLAVLAFVVADTWRVFESNLLNADRRQRDFTLRTALDAWARPMAGAALAWGIARQAGPVVAGFAGGSALVSVALLGRTVRGAEGAEPWRHSGWARSRRPAFLRYALPLVPLAALNWAMATGQRYLLAGLWNVEITGIYAAAFGLGSQPFLAANTLLQTTLRPVLYDAVSRGDVDKERRTLRLWYGLMLGIVVLGVVLLVILARPICALLLGEGYQGAAALLPWIGAAYGVQALQFTSEAILYAHGDTRRLSTVQAAGAAASVVLYLALIPRYSAQGAAMATLGAFLVSAVLAFVFAGASRRLGLRGV